MRPDSVPCVVMRGGTSKGVFFHDGDLPANPGERVAALLTLMGSPDPGEIDGLGGGTVTTSKVMIIRRAQSPGADIEFTFAQIGTREPTVEFSGTCGNLSAAVAPFAIDEGLVPAVEPVTVVRMLNANTRKLVVAEVPVQKGRTAVGGDYRIAGVPGTGPEIRLRYFDPAGAITGRLLPTGEPQQMLDLPGFGRVRASIVDAANPFVFIPAKDAGLVGVETPSQLLGRPDTLALVEAARCLTGVLIGVTATIDETHRNSPDIPKAAIIAPPLDYQALDGRTIRAAEYDLAARMIAIGEPIRAYALSGAICTAVAARIKETVVWDAMPTGRRGASRLLIGHASGIMDGEAQTSRSSDGDLVVESVSVGRTARRLMAGHALLPPGWRSRGEHAIVREITKAGMD